MAGKNKVERSFRFWFDDANPTARDISGDLVPGSVNIGDEYEEADMTGVSEGLRNYLSGHRDAEITARFHMNDTANTGASTVLNAMKGLTGTLTLQWGSAGAAPTNPDQELEGECVLLSNTIAVDGNKFVHDVRFKPTGSVGLAWGTVA
jgi:hypothetical protein